MTDRAIERCHEHIRFVLDDMWIEGKPNPEISEKDAWNESEHQRLTKKLAEAINKYPFTVARMIMDRCDTPSHAKEVAEEVIEWATGVRVQE